VAPSGDGLGLITVSPTFPGEGKMEKAMESAWVLGALFIGFLIGHLATIAIIAEIPIGQ